jgi:hypothetical protein
MRVCYFVQSHRGPAQIARLVATLKRGSPGAHVLVGHDARRCALDRRDLPDVRGVDLFVAPPPIERGRLSLLGPFWRALDRLADQGVEYDWLVYLSGQDYPTRPVAESEAFLAGSGADGFLRWWPAFAAGGPWGRRRQGVFRYGYQYRDLSPLAGRVARALRFVNRLQRRVHLHFTYGPRFGLQARHSPFGDRLTCYAGKQWTTLGRACVEYLRQAVRRETELLAYYDRTICPDESVVQTLLVNAGRFRLINDDLRFADFTASRDGSPRTLGVADLEALARGGQHFARKFDAESDARILDLLDQRLAPSSHS